jgi:fructokinase
MDAQRRYTIVGLGEVVWDLYPDGPRLGGAPANVAYHATVLGDRGVVASVVGEDELGAAARAELERRGVDVSLLQRDGARPTGTVAVQLAASGEVVFRIAEDAAWWHPTLSREWEGLLGQADALCFGTLLQASAEGREVLRRAAAAVSPRCLRLLDLNLRPPHDGDEAVEAALAHATALKLSEEELGVLATRSGCTEPELLATLLDEHGLQLVAITRGARGSSLVAPGRRLEHPGCPAADGGDPVGAGDAFTAALVHHVLRGHALEPAHAAASRYAAFVAGQRGAMPVVPESVVREVVGA